MQLALDTGNTRTKAAVFEGRSILENIVLEADPVAHLQALLTKYPGINKAISSSVVKDNSAAEQWLAGKLQLITFDHTTPLPIRNLYESPETLGRDRIAAAVGAWALYPNEDLLIIDAGTAVKVDIVTAKGEYLGGSIGPGLQMRFQALHHFTGRLPLIEADKNYKSLTGKNTRESILNGVQNGMLYELQGFIDAYCSQYPNIRIILTGGDAPFFESQLKNRIFAIPELLMTGLNEIVLLNAEA
jgi:type III pantothenate kinase